MVSFNDSVCSWSDAVDLIRHSWKQNRETPFDYSLQFIHGLLEYPGPGPVISPALYDDRELIAFVAGFPRSVNIDGRVRTIVLISFFTVAPEYQGRGHGRAIWTECLRRARLAGYYGAIHYCVDGHRSNAITVESAKSMGLETRRIFGVRHLVRLLRPGAKPVAIREANDTALFLEAAESLPDTVLLSKVWNAAEVKWQMYSPGHLYCTDGGGGVLTGQVLSIADAAHTQCCVVEDVLWHRLTADARGSLLARFLAGAAEIASMAIVPVLEYADLAPFVVAGFRRAPRVLNAYLTPFGDGPAFRELPSMYLEIL